MLVIYLLAVAPAAALLVVIFTGGWGSRAFYGYMLLALFLGTIHEGVVHLYERRAESRSGGHHHDAQRPYRFRCRRPLAADERVRRWFLVPRVGVTGHRWWLLLDRHDHVLVTLRVEGALLDPQSNALQLHSEVVVAIWPARQQF